MKPKKNILDISNTIFNVFEHLSFIITALSIFMLVSFLSTQAESYIIRILDYLFIFIIITKILYALFQFFYTRDTQKTLTDLGIGIIFLVLFSWAMYLENKPIADLKILFGKFSILLRMIIYLIYLLMSREKLRTYLRSIRLNPAQTFSLGFIFLIFLGVWLLSLPYSTVKPIPFVDRLFTSTSAVCVTGLITVDTASQFTYFGKGVILFLIQIGGLGIMSFSTFLIILSGRRMDFYDRTMTLEMFNQKNFQTLRRVTVFMILSTLIIELVGAVLIFFSVDGMEFWPKIFFSIFHSISAFCNAGFSTLSDGLVGFYSHINMNLIISSLIILGGLGFPVILSFKDKILKKKRFSLHSKIVIIMTISLIVFGMITFMLGEYNYSLKDMGFGDKVLSSFFQSVTTRTAGFNTVDMGSLNVTTYLWMIFLMFIGASPGSTGGGLKTTTFFSLLMIIYFFFKRSNKVSIFQRRIKNSVLIKAGALFFIRALIVFIATMVLMYIENFSFISVLFEVVSAFSTVGLTAGITSSLGSASKVIIILLMFIGRIGPLNILASLSTQRKQEDDALEYSEGDLIVE